MSRATWMVTDCKINRPLITNVAARYVVVLLVAALLLSFNAYAEPILFQQAEQGTPPATVRLPDGRIVPYGPGTICAVPVPDEKEKKSKKWILVLIPIGTGLLLIPFLNHDHPKPNITPNTPMTPITPDIPNTPVPEMPTGLLLAFGVILSGLFRKFLSPKKKLT